MSEGLLQTVEVAVSLRTIDVALVATSQRLSFNECTCVTPSTLSSLSGYNSSLAAPSVSGGADTNQALQMKGTKVRSRLSCSSGNARRRRPRGAPSPESPADGHQCQHQERKQTQPNRVDPKGVLRDSKGRFLSKKHRDRKVHGRKIRGPGFGCARSVIIRLPSFEIEVKQVCLRVLGAGAC